MSKLGHKLLYRTRKTGKESL